MLPWTVCVIFQVKSVAPKHVTGLLIGLGSANLPKCQKMECDRRRNNLPHQSLSDHYLWQYLWNIRHLFCQTALCSNNRKTLYSISAPCYSDWREPIQICWLFPPTQENGTLLHTYPNESKWIFTLVWHKKISFGKDALCDDCKITLIHKTKCGSTVLR